MKIIKSLTVFFILISGCSNKSEDIKISRFKERNHVETGAAEDTAVKNDEKNRSSEISSEDAKNRIGDTVTVSGLVADVHSGEKVSYLNFEKKFPFNEFSCAIFSGDRDKFGDIENYKNKNVEVTGKITKFRNKPQMILNSADQIRIKK